jgi:hypothetical protein
MSASIQLASRGQEDQWFTGKPNRTYFDTNQVTKEDRSRESFEVPFKYQRTTFGTTGICDVPVKADYLTGLTLRTTLPPIYTINPGQFVYPNTANPTVYVQISSSNIIASGGFLTANTLVPHGFSVGATVTLSGTNSTLDNLDNDGLTIASVPGATSFVCYSGLTGRSTTGTISSIGIIPTNIVGGYYSTVNSNLWIQIVSTGLSLSIPFAFSSSVYSNIYFNSAADAAFWGFDARQGLSYSFVNGTIKPPWTFQQSGWIPGFLPPSLSTYVDSVGNKLIKNVRLLVGKQLLNEFTGEYIELFNDLTVPYENKAILSLMNGTLDQTQSTFAREYYIKIPLGAKEFPIASLTHQQISIEIDFEQYTNLSQNLNAGTGSFTDKLSYTTSNLVSSLNLTGTLNIQGTLAYQQYIFLITFSGYIIVYDTTKDVTLSTSYVVVPASQIAGSSIFSQFLAFNSLYIQTRDGYISRLSISDVVSNNVNSPTFFNTNSFLPNYGFDLGTVTGTMAADSTHIYYAQSNLASTNVFISSYNTNTYFQTGSGYTFFDFKNNVTSIKQMLYTGKELVVIPNTSGIIYTTNNFPTFTSVNYSSFGTNISSGIVIGSLVYFVLDSVKFVTYDTVKKTFLTATTVIPSGLGTLGNMQWVGNYIYGSSNTLAVSTVYQINYSTFSTTRYSSTGIAPISFDGTASKIFTFGPRYIYMFTNDQSLTTNTTSIIRYDSSVTGSVSDFQASMIIDYESGNKTTKVSSVGIIQTQKINDMNAMGIRGPVKEIWFMGNSSSTNVYQYSNLSNQSTLGLTGGENILTGDVGTRTHMSIIDPFETHTSMPIRNISVIPFEILPESSVPNGTINFSRIRDQVFTGGANGGWARKYNILAIHGGIGGLMFN